MEIINKLSFKDSRDRDFAKKQIEIFANIFLDKNVYEHVEVTKENIYLKKIGNSGISHFPIHGFNPSTAKEMMIYISALNNAESVKKNFAN